MLRTTPRLALQCRAAAQCTLERLTSRACKATEIVHRNAGSTATAEDTYPRRTYPSREQPEGHTAERNIRRQRAVTNQPFIKNIFLGKFDKVNKINDLSKNK